MSSEWLDSPSRGTCRMRNLYFTHSFKAAMQLHWLIVCIHNGQLASPKWNTTFAFAGKEIKNPPRTIKTATKKRGGESKVLLDSEMFNWTFKWQQIKICSFSCIMRTKETKNKPLQYPRIPNRWACQIRKFEEGSIIKLSVCFINRPRCHRKVNHMLHLAEGEERTKQKTWHSLLSICWVLQGKNPPLACVRGNTSTDF